MQVNSFAAVYIGSYDIILEIFEISKKTGIQRIDTIRHRLELGKETIATGRISPETVDELCDILNDFKGIIDGYQVDGIRVIASSALREAQNNLFVLGNILQATGFYVEILSNSEMRFLSYKSVATLETNFNQMIEKGTAIVDLDSGSLQISLFDKGALVNTLNIRIGTLRIRERLAKVATENTDYILLVEELIQNEIMSFRKMYMKDRKIENVILLGDVFTWPSMRSLGTDAPVLSREDFQKWYETLSGSTQYELARQFGMTMDHASLVVPALVIYHRLVEEMNPTAVWLPGEDLARGLAYEFAEKQKLLKLKHDFENDIITAGKNIGKRYAVNRQHIENMDMNATAIFDATKKIHGRDKRDRLLLRLSVMLHDVGKYISCNSVAESNYNIIMANEIIGLSHTEREMVALITKYNTVEFPSYDELIQESSISRQQFIVVAELTAILRLVNVLDRSHKQKIQAIRVIWKDQKLVLNLQVNQDFTLELGTLDDKLEFFEEVFGVKPVLKIHRER